MPRAARILTTQKGSRISAQGCPIPRGLPWVTNSSNSSISREARRAKRVSPLDWIKLPRQHYSASKISSILSLNSFATLNASGKLGSYFSVSIAFTVCRETSSFSAKSACDHSFAARNSRKRFFTDTSSRKRTPRLRKKTTSDKTPTPHEIPALPCRAETSN